MFLANVYTVVDLEDNLVAMAQPNNGSSSENIEVISKSIPSASSVPSYSATYGGAAGTKLSVQTTGSLSGKEVVNVAARDVTSTIDASSSSSTSASVYESTNSNSNSTIGYIISTSENSAAQVSAIGALFILILASMI
ncbi:unnamed protein product [Ambrosiozyma monospora]|uniref:Unnamed protein product n=1 Tax=Ambrosiozyma monospora TaxID=43982 RepID=A0ACB5UBF9_AMBMO|nr:unnamed protein product [Ambrosiozyma monospora]